MKKLVLLVATIFMVTFASNNVQAQTRIGKDHVVDMGIHYGYGSGHLANFMGINLDFNAAKSNFRVRADFDALQRPVKDSPMVLGASFNAQYLFPLVKEDADGFYLYPSIGLAGDYHRPASGWGEKNWGFGFNLGGGAEYQFAEKWAFFMEGAYQVRIQNESHVGVMIGFSFAL